MSSNIILIGFMGSGKSTVGRILSKKCDKYFLDTDTMIESSEGLRVRQIFENSGESSFREMEKELALWLSKNVTNAVISTGGGMPSVVESFENMGQCVYLKIGFDELLERLKAEEFDKRPLFQDIEFARKIFNSRIPIYEKHAGITIDAMDTPHNIADKIREIIPQYFL